MIINKILLLILIWLRFILCQDEKYCNAKLCTDLNGDVNPHIGCPGNAQNQCPSDAKEIKMTKKLICLIVQKHNRLRNDLAGGAVAPFPSASRMPLLVRFLPDFYFEDSC